MPTEPPPPDEIEPPDLAGFRAQVMSAIETCDRTSRHKDDLASMLDAFTESYRALDRFKLEAQRVQSYAVGEPVLHRGSPAVVLARSAARVCVRSWPVPVLASDFPMTGRVRWLSARHLTKITSTTWEVWRTHMKTCGQVPEQWTTVELFEIAEPK